MGRSPTGGFRGSLARGGQKRGLQADFQAAIVQEIETLLGRQAVQGLDFEALETAARQQALQVAARALEGWLNADTSDYTGRTYPVPAALRLSTVAAMARVSKAFSAPCIWSELITTARMLRQLMTIKRWSGLDGFDRVYDDLCAKDPGSPAS